VFVGGKFCSSFVKGEIFEMRNKERAHRRCYNDYR
jgi:hypothetical protein